MVPPNPSAPPAPSAPVLGQGTFGAVPRIPALNGGPGNMAAPPAQFPSQPAARGGFAHSRGGSYPRTARVAPPGNPGNPVLAAMIQQVGPVVAANDDSSESEDDDDDDNGRSAIHIQIFTPINVRGDGNLIAMDTAVTATKIAQGITDALFSMTYGEAQGVPMIDEEGRPRPIKVVVSAPLTVLGSKNLMGERAVMERIAPGLKYHPAAPMTKVSLEEIGESGSVKKRDRDEAEEQSEEGESKRTRRN